jgi:hypothetical protein
MSLYPENGHWPLFQGKRGETTRPQLSDSYAASNPTNNNFHRVSFGCVEATKANARPFTVLAVEESLHRTRPLSGVKRTLPFVEFRFRGRNWE